MFCDYKLAVAESAKHVVLTSGRWTAYLFIAKASAAPTVSERNLQGGASEESDSQLECKVSKLPGEDEVIVNHDLQCGQSSFLFQGDLKLDEI